MADQPSKTTERPKLQEFQPEPGWLAKDIAKAQEPRLSLGAIEQAIVYTALVRWLANDNHFGAPGWDDIAFKLAERIESQEQERDAWIEKHR